jgi:hypothetical protein
MPQGANSSGDAGLGGDQTPLCASSACVEIMLLRNSPKAD